jgi:hypothetical protein
VHYANDLELVDPADHIIILMAGAFSQRRLGRHARAWADNCAGDKEKIKDNLAELASAEIDLKSSSRPEECKKLETRYCWHFRRQTLGLLRQHEAHVAAVATALLEHGTLSRTRSC